ncbi:MAG: Flp pilus assembly complex ATPase component TadA [Deltaproteobacteria bacterium]|nr:Flp pilus assembly complex ATPase component TadA [Deltaproteobacteria bacterium]
MTPIKNTKYLGVSQEDYLECLKIASKKGQPVELVLIARGKIEERTLLAKTAEAMDFEYRDSLSNVSVSETYINNIPIKMARSMYTVAISEDDHFFYLATACPFNLGAFDRLSERLGKAARIAVLAPQSEITALINKSYKHSENLVYDVISDIEPEEREILQEVDRVPVDKDILDIANKAPVIKIVDIILYHALKRRASDIHFHPYEDRLQVRFRIDGVLYDMFELPKKVQEAVVSRIKVMGMMDIAEKRLPQDGRASITIGTNEVDLRISSLPTCWGERVVLRLLDKSARLLELNELGLSESDLKRFQKLIMYTHGIILITGPTGSGKTTTLYATLRKLNTSEKNVLTLEDPIEYKLIGISQTQVTDSKGLSFSTGLRTVLRQDPDIIMVGEIRDLETARMAIQSALTGHLVFSTLHTNDSVSAATRLLDIGIEPYLVGSSLISVMAQRLVRKVCPHCKSRINPTEKKLQALLSNPPEDADLPQDVVLYEGKGCDDCMGTGYMDRTGIYELLVIQEDIRRMIVESKEASLIKKKAIQLGLTTLRMDGLKKAFKGITTVEEVMRVTQMDIL